MRRGGESRRGSDGGNRSDVGRKSGGRRGPWVGEAGVQRRGRVKRKKRRKKGKMEILTNFQRLTAAKPNNVNWSDKNWIKVEIQWQ